VINFFPLIQIPATLNLSDITSKYCTITMSVIVYRQKYFVEKL